MCSTVPARLAALTTVPAKLCGLEQSLGSIEKGKRANLTVVDGKGYFDAEAKVRSVWIDGRVYLMPVAEEKETKKTESAKSDASRAGKALHP